MPLLDYFYFFRINLPIISLATSYWSVMVGYNTYNSFYLKAPQSWEKLMKTGMSRESESEYKKYSSLVGSSTGRSENWMVHEQETWFGCK
jgi:hypothetical protein